jgi:hypothetical protein
MSVLVEQNPGARRKRATGDLYQYVGGTVDTAGIDNIKNTVCHER